ncbi:CCA tRNA nucleotidyltransferase [Magnetospira sp. QH-2]|uniref:CCA tRNA nucleotidyltransferase n=1 Tax=Magnetospira sp. (strain QH-2) TaxID=1288970 RepID=UPI0003E81263|nr:CCA tRNA nucleotidyltransferase [Magnetospira sp. QH-2]CCQ72727.1 Putative tRNA adenylyltransferase [Magnetospira sp. QH-2]
MAGSRIPPQPWMTAPETRSLFAALEKAGDEARFVGGCVRDAVLNRPVKDIDIATHLPPTEVIRRLEAADIHVIPTGLAHGTVTAVIHKTHFEITTLREDLETDGRRAKVAFTDDWTADAARRDFTINTLFCTLDGAIHDPFDGLIDLGEGRVRFVGDARQRCEEDILRVLRFFRFHAHYGRPPPDADALAACRAFAPRLPDLSGERIRNELFNILLAPDPASAIDLMHAQGALMPILPESGDGETETLRQLSWLEANTWRIEGIETDSVRRLSALLKTDPAGVAAFAHRLHLSNRQRNRLATLADPALRPEPYGSPHDLRKLLYKEGSNLVRDRLLLAWAHELATTPDQGLDDNERWMEHLRACAAWEPVPFPLRGKDALAVGVAHGPAMGKMLKKVEAWWINEDFQPDKAACLMRLRELNADH